MNFQIIKDLKYITAEPDETTQLYDLFELDSFGKNITVTPTQLHVIFDLFHEKAKATRVGVASIVASCVFENMGGSADTPPKDVMAWSFVCFATHHFQFSGLCTTIVNGIHLNNVLGYFAQMNIGVPRQSVDHFRTLVDQTVWDVLTDRHQFNILMDTSFEFAQKFMTQVMPEVSNFLLQKEGAEEFLNSLNINFNSNNK